MQHLQMRKVRPKINSFSEIDLERPYYLERLYEIDQSENIAFNLNLQHVRLFDETLYRKIVCYPSVSFAFAVYTRIISDGFCTEISSLL